MGYILRAIIILAALSIYIFNRHILEWYWLFILLAVGVYIAQKIPAKKKSTKSNTKKK